MSNEMNKLKIFVKLCHANLGKDTTLLDCQRLTRVYSNRVAAYIKKLLEEQDGRCYACHDEYDLVDLNSVRTKETVVKYCEECYAIWQGLNRRG